MPTLLSMARQQYDEALPKAAGGYVAAAFTPTHWLASTDGVGTKVLVAENTIAMPPLVWTLWPCVPTIWCVSGPPPWRFWIISQRAA
ncbi:MAG: hypothetical protein R2857_09735 [Vampirovibrionales bacterium]